MNFLNEVTHVFNQHKPECLKAMVEEWSKALGLGALIFRFVGSSPTLVKFHCVPMPVAIFKKYNPITP